MARIRYQEAIGLEVKRGRPAKPRPAREDLERLYLIEGRAVRGVAEALGVTKDAVFRALREYKITLRPCSKPSRLLDLDQERLFADIAEKGVDRTARAWGIPERTLKYYLARVRSKRP